MRNKIKLGDASPLTSSTSSAERMVGPDRKNRDLLAVYDLSVSPTSYDILSFLALVEMARRNGGHDRFSVVFVPAPGGGFWDKEATSQEEKAWRLQNLLAPSCWLWPACSSVLILGSREEARGILAAAGRHLYPHAYRLDAPLPDAFQLAHVLAARACGEPMPSWEAPARARDIVARWLGPRARGRRTVSITLRESSYSTERNSNLGHWLEFARRLDQKQYFVVFVRDTEMAFEPLDDSTGAFETFPTASVNLAVRGALYEESFLCMMSSSGPINLLFFNPRCRGIICDLLISDAPNASATVLRSVGWEIGRQVPLLGVLKRFVWQPATPDVLYRAFCDTVELIEAGPERAAAQSAQEAEPALRLARRLRSTARYDAARRIYESELAQRPLSTAALCGLSMTALDTPRLRFRRPSRLRATASGYLRKLTGAYYFLRAWRAGFTRWQTTDEALEIALCLERWRRRSSAVAIYRAILAQDPAEPTAHYRLALAARDNGEHDGAIRELLQTIAVDPYAAPAHWTLAELLEASGEADRAQQHYAMARRCDPSIAASRAPQRRA